MRREHASTTTRRTTCNRNLDVRFDRPPAVCGAVNILLAACNAVVAAAAATSRQLTRNRRGKQTRSRLLVRRPPMKHFHQLIDSRRDKPNLRLAGNRIFGAFIGLRRSKVASDDDGASPSSAGDRARFGAALERLEPRRHPIKACRGQCQQRTIAQPALHVQHTRHICSIFSTACLWAFLWPGMVNPEWVERTPLVLPSASLAAQAHLRRRARRSNEIGSRGQCRARTPLSSHHAAARITHIQTMRRRRSCGLMCGAAALWISTDDDANRPATEIIPHHKKLVFDKRTAAALSPACTH